MKLKTLKDRETQWMNSNIDQSKKDILLQFNHELKQEAIKWVKDICKKKHMFRDPDLSFHSGRVEMLKHFFNISEEDLKGGKI